jgi:hypothetical protein
VSEIFVFLNLTLHSFGPENFLTLVQIGKIQEGLIEKNESYKMFGTAEFLDFVIPSVIHHRQNPLESTKE